MTWLSTSITGLGLLFLAHGCYSAQEYSVLHAAGTSSLSTAATVASSLPLDIQIETVFAILLVCVGLVAGTPDLRPIQWRVWAGKIEREGEQGFLDASGTVSKDYVGNPFRVLESRPGFVKIRKQRQEFTEWIKEGNVAAS